MWNVKARHISILSTLYGVLVLVVAWLFGVLIRKLIGASFEDAAPETSGFWAIVFLDGLSFGETVGLDLAAAVLLSTFSALTVSFSTLRATTTGRQIRRNILESTLAAGRGDTAAEGSRLAKEIITNIKLIEDFQAYDEPFIFANYIIIALAFVLIFVFTWYAGILTLVFLTFSELAKFMFTRIRRSGIDQIGVNDENVNARLLDVVKNGTKIKIMGTRASERDVLRQLETSSDAVRSKDAQFRFYHEFFRLSAIMFIPAATATVGWTIVQSTDSSTDSINTGFALLVSFLCLAEGNKAVIFLGLVAERQRQALQARQSIDRFVLKKSVPDSETNQIKSSNSDGDSARWLPKQSTSPSISPDLEQGNSLPRRELSCCDSAGFSVSSQLESRELSFRDVMMTYPGRQHPVLSGYSKSYERGKIHGLIGESGSGKSTTLKILAALMIPNRGELVVWDGMKVAYVSQDQKLFSRSVRDNVTHAINQGTYSDQEVWAALRWALLDTWVESLPNCLDTLLQDGEENVSGGQLQRLHLAHLFCTCQDADLVVLDEVLSAVDRSSREILTQRLGDFLKGKTAIVVTHHSEMLSICDEVHKMTSMPPRSSSSFPDVEIQLEDLPSSKMKKRVSFLSFEESVQEFYC